MNKLMTVAALAVLLAACAKKEAEAPVAETAPAPAGAIPAATRLSTIGGPGR